MTPLFAIVLLTQMKPWTPPPNALPKAFVEATAFLLAHGMGDPRGGEFREATVATRDRRTGKPLVVRGWTFPNETPPRVVTTEGLVYPVAALKARLDPATVVTAWTATPAYSGVRPDGLFAALLLVAGRPDLAERLLKHGDDRYVVEETLLGLLRAEAEGAKEAFVQGDDALAEGLALKTVGQREGFEREAGRLVDVGHIAENFAFGGPLMERIAIDAARRAGRSRPPLDDAALRALPTWKRADALIDRLDDARVAGSLLDGVADPAADPIVEALVAIGDEAVEPLIRCVEVDRRLTRIGQMHSVDWFTIWSFVPVRDAAYRAIQKILKIQRLPGPDEGLALRRYWDENARRRPAERWLAVLADDAAGLEPWREAARNLFGGEDERFRKRPFAAETLSPPQRQNLGGLLARRATEPNAEGTAGFGLLGPLQFALDLALLDPHQALPTLQGTTRKAMARGEDLSWAQAAFAQAMERRGAIEGPPAWEEYAVWVERMRENPARELDVEAFRPLIDHRDLPRLRDAMRALLASKDSLWSIVPKASSLGDWWWWSQRFILSPLLDDPTFREATLEALVDRTPIGTVAVLERGVALEYPRGSSGWPNPNAQTDPLRPAPGAKRPIRVGDQVAMALARLKGAPAYQPYWADRERDAAIASLGRFARKNAGRLEALLPPLNAYGGR